MSKDEEFKEIGHCGGQFTVHVKTAEDGHRQIQFGIQHSRPTPASFFGIYAIPPGIPVGTMELVGMGDSSGPIPPGAAPIFIASDSQGSYGHQCPRCQGYWRAQGCPSRWKMTCAYCGLRAPTHSFRTPGQIKYVEACIELVQQALGSGVDGESAIDMDEVADAVGKDSKKPKFYYAEESQQNKYNCAACGVFNDILGKYGYCSICGTYNGVSEVKSEIDRIIERINSSQQYEACAKDSVAIFDSFARQLSKQLVRRIPMTPGRKKYWGKKLFHNLKPSAEDMKEVFDIDMFEKLKNEDIDFASLMFHRRHVYEHNGGEVDEKYIKDSGDTSVRLKQVIRENKTTATRIASLVLDLAKNIQGGFHSIFPVEEMPIRFHEEHKKRMKEMMSER